MLIIDASCPVNCGDCAFVLGGPRYDYCCICSEEVDDFKSGERPDFCPIKGEFSSASDLINTNAKKNEALIKLLKMIDERVDEISNIVSGIQTILTKEIRIMDPFPNELKEKVMKEIEE